MFSRFIAAQNAHDRAALAAVLLDSQEFMWIGYGGDAVWGYREAMEAFERQWQGIWKLEPQLKELRIASVATDTAVLVTPLLLTQGKPGADAATVTVSWGGVFVRTEDRLAPGLDIQRAAPGLGTRRAAADPLCRRCAATPAGT